MGILKSKSSQPSATTAKRRCVQTGFADLKPIKPGGTVGFTQFRDGGARSSGKKDGDDAMESDDEDEGNTKTDGVGKEGEGEVGASGMLSAEDAKKTGELAEGVKKIKVCYSPLLYHEL